MNGIYIEDVERDYRDGVYENKMEYTTRRKYNENHVFDENESVKWNREKVVEENELLKKARELYNAHTAELNEKFSNDCIIALQNEYELNSKQAEIVYNYVYREYHSSVSDMFNHFGEVTELVTDVLKNA